MNSPSSSKTCPQCGNLVPVTAYSCANCGYAFAPTQGIVPADVGGKKIAAGICGILLGVIGVHKFLLGYTGTGVIMLLVSVLSCGIASPIMGIIGIVEGIIYLTKTDQQFYSEYVVGRKEWF